MDAAFLREHLDDLVVVDCRFTLGDLAGGERAYRAGHIPGAAFLDVDRDLAAAPGDRGRHPLPAAADFQAAARRAGISNDSRVVAYDEAGEGGAARLWWLLRHFGHTDVTVLDGGLCGWREAGGALAPGWDAPSEGTFESAPRSDDIISRAEVADAVRGEPGAVRGAADAAPGAPLLLDARAPERYRGDVEPIDPVAGHIPGARNLPHATLDPDGRFLARAELRERFEAAGVTSNEDDVVAYCGSGITASVLVLAAEVAGLRAPRLYPGSWSEWCGMGESERSGT